MERIFSFIGKAIIVIGVLAGLLIGFNLETETSRFTSDPHPLRWVYGLSIIASSLISGLFMLGFGKVIELLTDIESRQYDMFDNTSKISYLMEKVAAKSD